jgi:DNA-directed RNA polymerase subunit RPC12/RpoP
MTELGPFHCPKCNAGYEGYHRCPAGSDRVEYECIDCNEHVNRETHQLDVDGVAPARCAECTFERMAET